jgi:hypothetical protein
MANEAYINRYDIDRIPINGPGLDEGVQAGLLKVVFAGQHEGFEEGSQFIWDFGDPYADLTYPNATGGLITVDYQNEDHAEGRFIFDFAFNKGQMILLVNEPSVPGGYITQSGLWWDQERRNIVKFKDQYIPEDGSSVSWNYYVDNKNFLVVDNPEELVVHTYSRIGKYTARLIGKLPNEVIVEATHAVTVGVITQA